MNNTLNKPLKSYSGMILGVALAALAIAALAFFVTKKTDKSPDTAAGTEQTQPVSNPAADGAEAPTAGGAPDNKTSGAPGSEAQ